jgi:hypothetical protein
LAVIERSRLGRSLIRLDGGDQERAPGRLGGRPIDYLSKLHQEPTGVITNRPYREASGASLFAKHLSRREATLWFIGPQPDRNLAADAVRSAYDANDNFY